MSTTRRAFFKLLAATAVTVGVAATIAPPAVATIVQLAGPRYYGVVAETFDYYISTTGNNSANGLTPGTAWAISSLIGTAHTSYTAQIGTNRGKMAGKKVGLSDGVYDIQSLWNSWFSGGAPLFQIPSGSAGVHTIIKAVNARQAILDGIDNTTITKDTGCIGQGYGGNNASDSANGYVTLSGLVVRNVGRTSGGGSNGIHFMTTSGRRPTVLVTGCEVYNVRGLTGNNIAAVAFQGYDTPILEESYLHDIYGTLTTDHEGYGLWQWTCDNVVMQYCTVEKVASCFYPKQVGHGSYTVRYNFFEPTAGHEGIRGGLSSGSGTDCYVYGNIFNTSLLWDGENYTNPVVENLYIYNNTFRSPSGSWDNGGGGGIAWGQSTFNSGLVRHYNNIYDAPSTVKSEILFRDFASIALSDYNVWTPSNTISVAPTGSWVARSLASWKSASSLDAGSTSSTPGYAGSPTSMSPSSFDINASSAAWNFGHVGGTSGGAAVHAGHMGVTTRVGKSW